MMKEKNKHILLMFFLSIVVGDSKAHKDPVENETLKNPLPHNNYVSLDIIPFLPPQSTKGEPLKTPLPNTDNSDTLLSDFTNEPNYSFLLLSRDILPEEVDLFKESFPFIQTLLSEKISPFINGEITKICLDFVKNSPDGVNTFRELAPLIKSLFSYTMKDFDQKEVIKVCLEFVKNFPDGVHTFQELAPLIKQFLLPSITSSETQKKMIINLLDIAEHLGIDKAYITMEVLSKRLPKRMEIKKDKNIENILVLAEGISSAVNERVLVKEMWADDYVMLLNSCLKMIEKISL